LAPPFLKVHNISDIDALMISCTVLCTRQNGSTNGTL